MYKGGIKKDGFGKSRRFFFRLLPSKTVDDIECKGENRQNYEADNRPFLHSCFNGFAFVFPEERFARSAEGANARGVARLHEYQNDRGNRCNEHQHN